MDHTSEDFNVASMGDAEINGLSTCKKVDSDSELILFVGFWLSFSLAIGAEEHINEGVLVGCSFHLENQRL